MRTVIVTLLLGFALNVSAQRECASHQYVDQLTIADPSYKNRLADIETFIQRHMAVAATSRLSATTVVKIPVVIHVLYNKATQNISDAQIKSQIDALNRDYRKKNADTANTPDRFKGIAADAGIEFALATADPSGRATTGIIRKQTSVSYWQPDDKIKLSAQGGDDAWDTKSYLNIWVGYMHTLLGYSSAPGGPADKDGVVINVSAFGTMNVSAPYDLGRTATHEVGHWLGLRHIWGDESCGNDFVDDTPVQGSFTSGCPNGFRTTCNNGSLGDMYMNYMDFTNDACLNLFTKGQKERMRALFDDGGPRYELLNSKGLNTPWNTIEEAPVANEVIANAVSKIFPNPAQNEITLTVGADAKWIGKEVRIVSISGGVIQKVIIATASQKINIANLKAGMYLLQGENGADKFHEKLIKL